MAKGAVFGSRAIAAQTVTRGHDAQMVEVQHVGDGRFTVGGDQGGFRDRNDRIVAPSELLRDVSARSLRDALAAYGRFAEREWGAWPDELEVWLASDPVDEFDEDFFVSDGSRLQLDEGQLRLIVPASTDSDPADVEKIDLLLSPLAERLRTPFVAYEDESWSPVSIVVDLEPPIRGKTVGQLLEIGKQFEVLLAAGAGGGLDPSTAADLLRGGHAQVLVGQREAAWLDAKRQPYNVETVEGKLAFAKDVAAFANTQAGGLIALGLRTSPSVTGDVIDRVTPFPSEMMRPPTLRAVIRGRVYPVPLGVAVDVVPTSESEAIGLIHLPPQPEERKPFLVRGTAINGRIRDKFISVPTRVGEDTIFDDLAAIHSLIVAGRAALSQPLRQIGASSLPDPSASDPNN